MSHLFWKYNGLYLLAANSNGDSHGWSYETLWRVAGNIYYLACDCVTRYCRMYHWDYFHRSVVILAVWWMSWTHRDNQIFLCWLIKYCSLFISPYSSCTVCFGSKWNCWEYLTSVNQSTSGYAIVIHYSHCGIATTIRSLLITGS